MLNQFITFVLCLSYLLNGSSIGNEIFLTHKENEYKSSNTLVDTSYVEPINYVGDNKIYFTVYDFEVSNLGNERTKEFQITYRPRVGNLTYAAEFGYTYLDGDYVTECEDVYFYLGRPYLVERSISFVADFDKFSYPYYEMYLMITCYFKKNIGGTFLTEMKYELSILFTLAHYGGIVETSRNTVKVPYRFVYTANNYQCDIYYDYIDFLWFEKIKTDQLYFRIKPEELTFMTGGYEMNADVKLRILDTNAFDSTITDPNSNNPYYHLIRANNFDKVVSLRFKNQIHGGPVDLYLNPFSLEMAKTKSQEYKYKVNNIYLPKNNILKSSGLSIEIELTFGRVPLSIIWPMKIEFSSDKIENYYSTKMVGNKVSDDDLLEEVKIP